MVVNVNRERTIALLLLILIALLYFAPKMVRTFMEAYRKGAEIREQQGR